MKRMNSAVSRKRILLDRAIGNLSVAKAKLENNIDPARKKKVKARYSAALDVYNTEHSEFLTLVGHGEEAKKRYQELRGKKSGKSGPKAKRLPSDDIDLEDLVKTPVLAQVLFAEPNAPQYVTVQDPNDPTRVINVPVDPSTISFTAE